MSKVAIVTGGTGALGRAVCERLASDGYEVFATAISQSDAAAFSGRAQVAVVDLADFDACKAWVSTLPTKIHAAALLAGGFAMEPLTELTAYGMQNMLNINLLTASNALATLSPMLMAANGASVVLVSSQAYNGAAGMSAYVASKAAVFSLANSAAAELKRSGVRVNTIMPDIIDTPANRKAMPNADYNNWQKPEEVAAIIGFLCSDDAKIISGNSLRLGR